MTVTTLDLPTALVVIDPPHGILASPTVHPLDEVAGQNRRAIRWQAR